MTLLITIIGSILTPEFVEYIKKKGNKGKHAALAVSIIIAVVYTCVKFFVPEYLQVGMFEFFLMFHGAMTIVYEHIIKSTNQ